jgi:predicted ATPase
LKYFGDKSFLEQSLGQSIMAFFRSRYRLKGLYFLDEPETALSPRTQIELLEILRESGGGGQAQFIIATHSPILLALENVAIFSFDQSPAGPVTYKETARYQIYKDFLMER